MTRKDPKEAFDDLVRKRQETPVPDDVEERLRSRLHAFRQDLEMKDERPLLPRAPRFGRPKKSLLPAWAPFAAGAILAAAAGIGLAVVLNGM